MDQEIDRTLRKQQKWALQETVEAQGKGEITINQQPIETMAKEANRQALRDFALSGAQGAQTSILKTNGKCQ